MLLLLLLLMAIISAVRCRRRVPLLAKALQRSGGGEHSRVGGGGRAIYCGLRQVAGNRWGRRVTLRLRLLVHLRWRRGRLLLVLGDRWAAVGVAARARGGGGSAGARRGRCGRSVEHR